MKRSDPKTSVVVSKAEKEGKVIKEKEKMEKERKEKMQVNK
jgi:hypothetical protein